MSDQEHHGEKELASFIRAGAERRPEQAYGDYFKGQRASCALGAAYEGMYRLPRQAEGAHPTKDLDWFFDCLEGTIRRCPRRWLQEEARRCRRSSSTSTTITAGRASRSRPGSRSVNGKAVNGVPQDATSRQAPSAVTGGARWRDRRAWPGGSAGSSPHATTTASAAMPAPSASGIERLHAEERRSRDHAQSDASSEPRDDSRHRRRRAPAARRARARRRRSRRAPSAPRSPAVAARRTRTRVRRGRPRSARARARRAPSRRWRRRASAAVQSRDDRRACAGRIRRDPGRRRRASAGGRRALS